MDKKKRNIVIKETIEIEEPTRSDIPAMVTEIVEDNESTIESVKQQSEEHNKIDPLELQNTKSTHHESEKVDDHSEEDKAVGKSKEVVQELFSKPGSNGLTEISVGRKRRGKPLFWWAVIVIVAAVTTGLGMIVFTTKSPSVPFMGSNPTPTLPPAPSPTVAPVVKKEDLKLQVLNGGGIGGAATKMKNFLTEAGYQVSDVGNTDEYTYDQTQIQVKSDGNSIYDMLKTDLSSDYTIGTPGATLPTESEYDAIVIVGKE